VSRPSSARLAALCSALFLAACGRSEPPPDPVEDVPPPAAPDSLSFTLADWDAMADWDEGEPDAAFSAFRRSCAVWSRRDDAEPVSAAAAWAGTIEDWRGACVAAEMAIEGPGAARAVFEAMFTPVGLTALAPATEEGEDATRVETGLLTGYYEPELEVRSRRGGEFTYPLRGRPDDLVTVNLGDFDDALAGRSVVGRVQNGRLSPYAVRAEIDAEGPGDPFAWGRPIDVFFLQIQGSGRLVYEDGRTERAAFAAHNGRPYRSIGRELIERGELEAHAASKAGIEAWLNRAGPRATRELFAVNPRYVFFGQEPLDDPELGPRGSAGIPLTPMASLAVDPLFLPHGAPVWLDADLPEAEGWAGLLIAQDSGGAIRGPLRGDLFYGWGDVAERRAGSTRSRASWILLLPHAVADRLADDTPPA
jgi:membrane-bound lytic murein transglycosylase A